MLGVLGLDVVEGLGVLCAVAAINQKRSCNLHPSGCEEHVRPVSDPCPNHVPPTSRPRPVCHIHAPYPSSSARSPHPCLGSRASPPSHRLHHNIKPMTPKLSTAHVPSVSRMSHPRPVSVVARSSPSSLYWFSCAPVAYLASSIRPSHSNLNFCFCSGSDSSKHGVLRQRYSATGPHDAPGGPTQAKKIVTKLRGAKKQRLT